MSKKRESSLKLKLVTALKAWCPEFVLLRHEDYITSGIPDLSVTGNGRTTWWEVKHGTPDFESKGIQELTLKRLARAGYARYIIFKENSDGSNKRIFIVHPDKIGNWEVAEEGVVGWLGFDYKTLALHIRSEHQQ
jgi:hypothetical protein